MWTARCGWKTPRTAACSGSISSPGNGRTGVATTAKGETIRGYGLPSDKDNNLYLMSFGDTRIGKLDAKTNVAQIWSTAFARSRPRRGRFDDQNRLWFAEYAANRIAMFDPTTEQIKEWKLPTNWSQPYDVVPSKGAAEVWTGSMLSDQVANSTRRPTRSSNICCRTPPTSGACSSRRPERARCCGSATITAAPSSR